MELNCSQQLTVDFSDIVVRSGGYLITLNNASHEPPRYPWNIRMHSHNSYEIHYIKSGSGSIATASATYPVRAGAVIITGPDIPHAQTSGLSDPMEEYCVNISLEPMKKTASDDMYRLLRMIEAHPFFVGENSESSCEDCAELLNEAVSREYGYRERISALLQSLLIKLARLIEKSGREAWQESIPSDRPINRKRMIDRYLRQYDRPVDIDELAELLYVSRRQLSRIIKQYYSMTLTEKINAMRLDYAKQLIKTTSLTIADISVKAGFSSVQYFYRLFRKTCGMNPSQFRDRQI